MAHDQNDDSKPEITPEDVFKHHKADAIHTGAKLGLSVIPLASEIFELLIAAPASKRRKEFWIRISEDLKRLEEKVEGFSIEGLAENETFQSTLIQATQAAIRTHQREKHEALRNAVLNSALPNSPDENRQAVFIALCDELTGWHVNVLRLFEGDRIPSIYLDDPSWRSDIALDKLANLIEATYPVMQVHFDLYVQIIDDLLRRGLIANHIPEKDFPAELHNDPKPTPLAREFLAFLNSPLED